MDIQWASVKDMRLSMEELDLTAQLISSFKSILKI